MKAFNCYACSTQTPESFGHQHHLVPQAAGGTDKDIVWLCGGCHQQAHAIAYMLLNPKRSNEVDEALLFYKEEKTRKAIAKLAYTVAKEMTLKADGLKEIEDQEKSITFNLSKNDYMRVLFAAKDRRMSIAKFVHAVLMEQVGRLL